RNPRQSRLRTNGFRDYDAQHGSIPVGFGGLASAAGGREGGCQRKRVRLRYREQPRSGISGRREVGGTSVGPKRLRIPGTKQYQARQRELSVQDGDRLLFGAFRIVRIRYGKQPRPGVERLGALPDGRSGGSGDWAAESHNGGGQCRLFARRAVGYVALRAAGHRGRSIDRDALRGG